MLEAEAILERIDRAIAELQAIKIAIAASGRRRRPQAMAWMPVKRRSCG